MTTAAGRSYLRAAEIHPWQAAGLGNAPFEYDRFERASVRERCDACGHFLKRMFWVRSADGLVFKVGSDCINKVEPNHSPLSRAALAAIEDSVKRDNEARVERARALLAANPSFLADVRHGRYPQRTIRKWALFTFEHGGQRKREEACRLVEKYWNDRQEK
jgi:hypothetical protein